MLLRGEKRPRKGVTMTLYSIGEAAEELRTSKITIRRMVKAGSIPYRRMGSGGKNPRIFFTPEDLQSYIEAAAVPARKRATEAGRWTE
jgi:excisionase family DNA binding protein